MFSLPDFLDIDFYLTTTEISTVVIQASLLALLLSIWTSVLCFRSALQKHDPSLFWLGGFSVCYGAWNLLYLISDITISEPSFGLTLELWLWDLHRNDRVEAISHIAVLEFTYLLIYQSFFQRDFIDDSEQG